jgi:hypothetical protein
MASLILSRRNGRRASIRLAFADRSFVRELGWVPSTERGNETEFCARANRYANFMCSTFSVEVSNQNSRVG